ncbi:hypothetical protein CGMCC3_g13620 [Colletotrichum fructicola]|nr:uncharacterized protein CGMCC3_g13620 [Colletotrichum fructicola]KAE9570249.1 hypothetical protein CGMCC3_g13620 [Colletotrichum fructicola]
MDDVGDIESMPSSTLHTIFSGQLHACLPHFLRGLAALAWMHWMDGPDAISPIFGHLFLIPSLVYLSRAFLSDRAV